MIAFLATLLPGYLDYLLRPLSCPANQWCLDFRGFTFGVYALVLVPLAALLATTAWLWRKRHFWPAIFPIGVDLFILLGETSLVLFPSGTLGPSPSVAGKVLLLLAPAIGSLVVVVAMLKRGFSGRPAKPESTVSR
jgi:hypothetical protein